MRQESLKPRKIKELHFKPEGYISYDDEEFLNQFLNFIEKQGLKPQELIFSGLDATDVARGGPLPDDEYVFGMNVTAWRQAATGKDLSPYSPATYASGWDTPCIGLYDKSQLAHAYSYTINESKSIDDRMELEDIEAGEPLSSYGPDEPIEEVILHKNHPDGSPNEALVGLVYLEDN